MESTTDRRKIRSRQYLTHALLDLMQEKNFEQITIHDLVSRAYVSRSTFYFQFEDKYDFLNAIIDEVLSDLEQEVLAAYLDGKSYQEIADNLGRHVKSIDNALQRVKRKLERYLEDMEAQNND